MIRCRDVADYIENLCPVELACNWDNVGLLVGDMDKEVKTILVALDVDEQIVAEAKEFGADMIISHHPVMFHPLNRMTQSDPQQRAIRLMCKYDICHYAAHTNMDCAKGGLNDYLAKKLELKGASVFEPTVQNAGFGRMAKLEVEKTLENMLLLCKKKLNLSDVRYVGDLTRKISTVVVNSGSGSDCLAKCIAEGVDLLITGDLKYNVARDAYENGVAVIDAGHYGTEIIFTELVSDYLKKGIADVQINISKSNKPVINSFS